MQLKRLMRRLQDEQRLSSKPVVTPKPRQRSPRCQRERPHPVLKDVPRQRKQSQQIVQVYLREVDVVTGDEDSLCALFYESYRGYTLYSKAEGVCCMHGQQGCLRLQGQFVSFPDVEDAKNAIKYFRNQGWRAQQSMDRTMAKGAYVCLNDPLTVSLVLGFE